MQSSDSIGYTKCKQHSNACMPDRRDFSELLISSNIIGKLSIKINILMLYLSKAMVCVKRFLTTLKIIRFSSIWNY